MGGALVRATFATLVLIAHAACAQSDAGMTPGKLAGTQEPQTLSTVDPGATSYYARSIDDLKRLVPGLKGLRYDSSQNRLPAILSSVAKTIAGVLPRLPDLVSREDIYHFQSVPDPNTPGGLAGAQPWSRQYRFLLLCRHNRDGSTSIEESRIDGKGNPVVASGPFTALTGSGFAYQWLFFSADNQPEFHFRYLGQELKQGRQTFVIAFAQVPNKVAKPAQFEWQGKSEPFYFQGVLWVDQATSDIVVLRTDLLAPLLDLHLRQLTTELTFRSVPIKGFGSSFWLPSEVYISSDRGAGLAEESHRYSHYHLFHAQARIIAEH
jgi:hypothetical protein